MTYSHYLEQYFSRLAELLVSYGVPADQGQFAALVATYLGLTLLVLLLVVLLLRGRRGGKQRREVEPPVEAEVEPSETDSVTERVQSVETAESPRSEPERVVVVSEQPSAKVAAEQEPLQKEEVIPPQVKEPVAAAEVSFFQRLRQGLAKTRGSLLSRVDGLISGRSRLDDEFVEELEEILITADFGMQATQELIDVLTARLRDQGGLDASALRQLLHDEIRARLRSPSSQTWTQPAHGPLVIMVVGVNGVGKTTTIGKLAKQFADQGKKVVLGAGDTFRAAASQQLQVWGERAGAEVICHAEGSDPAAVAFDAAKAAMARHADVLILDTAGRLHTKVNLMEELKKVRRVLGREIVGAPHETLLVLDATTGQNALSQAKIFQEAVEVSGIALTKLDGTAKGGIVVAITTQLDLPVRLIGVGEGVGDLRPFDADEFVDALFAVN